MPDNAVHMEDCHLLGIDADANLGEAERAWRNLKAIYAEDSLATYGLLEDPVRRDKLEELQEAYDRVVQRLSGLEAKSAPSPAPVRVDCPEQLSPEASIGQYLRDLREESGLTLRDIANRTKVSPMRLEQIEKEVFERLPEAVYLRGFVLEYAKVLGFSQPQEVAGMYLARCRDRMAHL